MLFVVCLLLNRRFTVTMDPTIDKAKIVEMRNRIREDGKARRRNRRLNRVLDSVSVGDSVEGVVDQVLPEGIILTLPSLGPMNMTGILGRRDLPRIFAVPADMSPSFQVQLLQQDFVPGRKVLCSVLKIHPKLSDRVSHHFQLAFESFGEMPVGGYGEELDIDALPDSIEIEDEDDEDEEEEDEEDLEEIFSELKGKKGRGVSLGTFRDWEDTQDLLFAGEIDEEDLKSAFRSAGLVDEDGAANEMNFEQFKSVIGSLQDARSRRDVRGGRPSVSDDLNDEEDEDDVDEDIAAAAEVS